MKKVVYIIAAFFVTVVLSACVSGGVVYNEPAPDRAANGETWTVMVYMCGGGEESANGTYSKKLEAMTRISYPENVNVIVQTGGSEDWDMHGVYGDYSQRFVMRKNKMYLADQSAPVDMGDYRSLEDFLLWGKKNYEASRYMLVISGEGGGTMYGTCYDELNGGGGLSLSEIAYAMSLDGSSFDLVAFDTPLMGSIETATQLSTYAEYMVASQDIQSSDGWDYEGFLKYLCDNPSADGAEIGAEICDAYYDKCCKDGTTADAAMSVTDMSKMSTLNQAFNGMAGDMLAFTDTIENYGMMSKILDSVHIYGGASEDEGFSNSMDIGDMAMKMKPYIGETADVLIDALNDSVVYRVCGGRQNNSAGLSVYYPLNRDNDQLEQYMKIAAGVRYKEFLRKSCINCSVSDDTSTGDYTASTAWQSYNEQMGALEYMAVLNPDSYELYVAGNMNLFKDVAMNVYKADKSGNLVSIGQYQRINANTEMGIFQDNFDRKMLRLYSKNVTPTLIRRYEEYDLYSIPVMLNGERKSIRAAFYPNSGKYEILGAWPYVDNGRVSGTVRKIGFFDSVRPLLRVYDEEHKTVEYIEGGSKKRMLGDMSEAICDDGSYIFEYELTDIYGEKRRATPVDAGITGGRVTFRQ